jgi:hypothetical protein
VPTLPGSSVESPTPSAAAPTPPSVTEAPVGAGAVTVNGVVMHSTVTSHASRVVLAADGLTLQVATVEHGHEAPARAHNEIWVHREGELYVSISGFKTGTIATVWGFSTPTLLGHLTIHATHDSSGQLTLPASMRAGAHTLVVTGTAASGKHTKMAMGIRVTDSASATTPTTTTTPPVTPATAPRASALSHGGGMWWWPILGLTLVGLLAAAYLLARRRRYDEEADPQA